MDMQVILEQDFLDRIQQLGEHIQATPIESAFMLATVRLVANPVRLRERHLELTKRFVQRGVTIGIQVALDKVLAEHSDTSLHTAIWKHFHIGKNFHRYHRKRLGSSCGLFWTKRKPEKNGLNKL